MSKKGKKGKKGKLLKRYGIALEAIEAEYERLAGLRNETARLGRLTEELRLREALMSIFANARDLLETHPLPRQEYQLERVEGLAVIAARALGLVNTAPDEEEEIPF